jgi:hypothetical protein
MSAAVTCALTGAMSRKSNPDLNREVRNSLIRGLSRRLSAGIPGRFLAEETEENSRSRKASAALMRRNGGLTETGLELQSVCGLSVTARVHSTKPQTTQPEVADMTLPATRRTR